MKKIRAMPLVVLGAIAVLLMASLPSSAITNDDEKKLTTLEKEYSMSDLGLSEEDAATAFSALRSKTISLTEDGSGGINAEIIDTLDAGRLGADRTSDGFKIYLDSYTASRPASAIGLAAGSIIGNMAVPVAGGLAGGLIGWAIGDAVSELVTRGLKTDTGIIITIKCFNNYKVFGIPFSLPCPTQITGVTRQ